MLETRGSHSCKLLPTFHRTVVPSPLGHKRHASWTAWLWKWQQHGPLKHRYLLTTRHGVTSYKTRILRKKCKFIIHVLRRYSDYATSWINRRSNPAKGKKFFTSLPPWRLSGPPSLLFSRHCGSFPAEIGCGMKLTTHLQLAARLKMRKAIHSPIWPHNLYFTRGYWSACLQNEWLAINYRYEITFIFCFMLNPRSFSTFLSHLQAITKYFSHKVLATVTHL